MTLAKKTVQNLCQQYIYFFISSDITPEKIDQFSCNLWQQTKFFKEKVDFCIQRVKHTCESCLKTLFRKHFYRFFQDFSVSEVDSVQIFKKSNFKGTQSNDFSRVSKVHNIYLHTHIHTQNIHAHALTHTHTTIITHTGIRTSS